MGEVFLENCKELLSYICLDITTKRGIEPNYLLFSLPVFSAHLHVVHIHLLVLQLVVVACLH